jgi:peroxiredoxin
MMRLLPLVVVTNFFVLASLASFGGEKQNPPHLLPDDPELAWAEVGKVHQALQPPPDWRTRTPNPEEVAAFQQQVRQTAWSFANKAREFITRFPTNENIGDARITFVHALTQAVAAGDAKAEKEIQAYLASVLADRTIPEDDRVVVLLYSGNVAFTRKVGMRLFTEGKSAVNEDFESNSMEVTRSALKQFPTNSFLYTALIAFAQRSNPERQQELAKEIRDAPGAPAGAKTLAEHLLKGTKPYEIGKPVDIRFTALDGRVVDLANLKGKVVLVEFWSTSCGPCIAEMPSIKAAYEKLHVRGFEVVAISLDDKESALRRFIADKKLPWPQHFDGKGWENQFAMRYGVFSIPTMWLVDKRGNLCDTNPWRPLEQRIETLLAEQP